jgi:hypothetical protein
MMREAERYVRSMTEAQMLAALRDYTLLHRGRFFHIRDARGQELAGLPDALVFLPGVVGFIEVKTQRDRVTPAQAELLRLLQTPATVVAAILRPVPKAGERSLDAVLALLEAHRVE